MNTGTNDMNIESHDAAHDDHHDHKPTGFMNRSGESVGAILEFSGLSLDQMLIVVDDFNHIAHDWWPALLILVGLGIIFGSARIVGGRNGGASHLAGYLD